MGTAGLVRLHYQARDGGPVSKTPWQEVNPQRDFTTQIRLTGLKPATSYTLTAEARVQGEGASTNTCGGGFSTAPLPSSPATTSRAATMAGAAISSIRPSSG